MDKVNIQERLKEIKYHSTYLLGHFNAHNLESRDIREHRRMINDLMEDIKDYGIKIVEPLTNENSHLNEEGKEVILGHGQDAVKVSSTLPSTDSLSDNGSVSDTLRGCGKRFRKGNSLLYCGRLRLCDECQERHKEEQDDRS